MTGGFGTTIARAAVGIVALAVLAADPVAAQQAGTQSSSLTLRVGGGMVHNDAQRYGIGPIAFVSLEAASPFRVDGGPVSWRAEMTVGRKTLGRSPGGLISGDTETLRGAIGLRIPLMNAPAERALEPYAVGGAAVSRLSTRTTLHGDGHEVPGASFSETDSEVGFGGFAGLGLHARIIGLQLFAETRGHVLALRAGSRNSLDAAFGLVVPLRR